MFRDARVLERQRTADSFRTAASRYAAAEEAWFDGSVGSIDARLAQCDRLLHAAHIAVSRTPLDSASYLNSLNRLKNDRQALASLREDMLNGGQFRQATPAGGMGGVNMTPQPGLGTSPSDQPSMSRQTPTQQPMTTPQPAAPPPMNNPPAGTAAGLPTSTPTTAALSGMDRRWVNLESAKFVAANAAVAHDPEELATRAQHFAQVKTSTFTSERSAQVCRAFVGQVLSLRPRQASVPQVRVAAVNCDFDPQMMFL